MRFRIQIVLGKFMLVLGFVPERGLFVLRRHFSRGKGGGSFPRKGPASSWLQWDRLL